MISKRLAVALATSVLALAPPSGASAQDVPVVFVHGIFSSSETWRGTSDRLASVVQITPHLVDMPSTATLDAQTAVLNAAQGSLPTNTIAVGHSQGGLISRQWSRSRPLKGILTLGTPHGGSLLTKNALDLIRFNGMVYNLVGLAGTYGASPEFGWVVSAISIYLADAQLLSASVAHAITATVAVDTFVPVAPQLAKGSAFLNSLNSFSNLAREDQAIARRVGLVYTANDYWRAGAAVGLSPGDREWAWWVMLTAPPIFEAAAAWVDVNYPVQNFLARAFATRLRNLAAVTRDMDPMWCWAVTGDRSCQTPHDGLVSVVDQVYPGPGALNFGVYGPAHTQETKRSDAEIRAVLTGVMNVASRGAAPPPVTGGGGGGGSDVLSAGHGLGPDEHVTSSDGAFELLYQSDGNLVLYGPTGPVWASDTAGASAGRVEMQGDGNLVIYDATGIAMWASDTFIPGSYLTVHREGYLMMHDPSGVGVWWSGSGAP